MCELIHEGQPTTRAVGQGTGHLIKVGSEAGTAVLTFLKRASALQLREYSKAELLCPSSPPPRSGMLTHSQERSVSHWVAPRPEFLTSQGTRQVRTLLDSPISNECSSSSPTVPQPSPSRLSAPACRGQRGLRPRIVRACSSTGPRDPKTEQQGAGRALFSYPYPNSDTCPRFH